MIRIVVVLPAPWSKKPGDVARKNAETQPVECDDRAEVFGK